MGVKPYCKSCCSSPCCCPIKKENKIRNNPSNTNTSNPTINVNPVINIPPTKANGERGLLTEFDGSVTPAPITITEPPADPVTLGTVRLFIDDLTDRVLLQATIPWRIDLEDETGLFGPIFRILRNGDPIFEAIDTLQITDGFCFNRITSITFLDENPPLGVVTYTLTALRFCSEGGPFTVSTSAATTFTASEIEGNTP